MGLIVSGIVFVSCYSFVLFPHVHNAADLALISCSLAFFFFFFTRTFLKAGDFPVSICRMHSGKGGREVVDKDWNYLGFYISITKPKKVIFLCPLLVPLAPGSKSGAGASGHMPKAISATKAGRASSSFCCREAGSQILKILKL